MWKEFQAIDGRRKFLNNGKLKYEIGGLRRKWEENVTVAIQIINKNIITKENVHQKI